MATASPHRPWNRADAQRRVRHPLQALRGTIRRYVALEGLAVGVLYLAACFWLGVALDWGLFALFRFDWIKEVDRAAGNLTASSWLRVGLLALVLSGLVAVVAFKVLRRLFREFSDRALALVLERRFPRDLGDRLITAVEMADPELCKKYGFSQEMLDRTIAEAADRVERLPVQQVFNWGRLYWRLIWAGVAVVGVYLVAGIVSCIVSGVVSGNASPVAYFWEFNHVAGTWFDRNVLVQDRRYWLGNEYLEVVRFPETRKRDDGLAELRVARDEFRPEIWVRAVQWVVADRGPDAPEGWHALRWSDLDRVLDAGLLARVNIPPTWGGWVIDLDDLDPSVPAGVIPPEWGWQGKTAAHIRADLQRPDVKAALTTGRGAEVNALAAVERLLDWRTWTVDQIERQVKRVEVRQALDAAHKAAYVALDEQKVGVFGQLAALADAPSMRGTLRVLNAPEFVTIHRRGKASKSSSPASKQEGNKYSFSLNELKESVTFTVSGDEYTTPPRAITLVPPPSVVRLTIDKQEPAYLHYRLLGEDADKLKGLRQTFRGVPMSTTGTKSVIPVPLGSDVTVTAVVDRRLKAGVRLTDPVKRDEPGSLTPKADVTLLPGGKSFEARFEAVTRTIEFDFEYRDEDNVKGRRHIVIKPNDDKAPTLVGVVIPVALRLDYDPESGKGPASKSGDRLLITPSARLPFKGLIADDHGLARLEYTYVFKAVEFQKLGGSADLPKDEPGLVLEGNPVTRRAGLVVSTFQYAPGMPGFEWFAPAYLGGLKHAAADLGRPPSGPDEDKGVVELEFGQRRLTTRLPDDVTFPELQRLLEIQPRNRHLAVELLKLKGDTEEKLFLKRLQDLGQHEAVLTDTLQFLELDDAQRIPLLAKIDSDPAEVVRGLVALAAKDKEKTERDLALLTKAPERSIVRDHQLDNEGRIKFDEDARRWRFESGNGLDVRTYLPKLKAPTGETQRHYELHVFVSATDNNVETGPTKGPVRGPFVFLVVSELELVSEISKQEQKLYALLKEAKDTLDSRKTTLEADLLRLDSLQFVGLAEPRVRETVEYMRALAVRAEQARKSVRDAGEMSRTILERYNTIIAELLVNRVEIQDKLAKVEEKIAGPLHELTHKTDGDFVFVDRGATKLFQAVDDDATRLRKAETARKVDAELLKELEQNRPVLKDEGKATVDNMARLSKRLDEVLQAMADVGDIERAIRELVLIETQRRELHRQLEVYYRKLIEEVLGPAVGGK